MENQCFRCERSDNQVKLVDVIYEREITKICEECLVNENLPVIRKPSSEQLKDSERPYSVAARMRRMSGLPFEKKTEVFIPSTITLDKLRKPKDYKSVLDNRFSQAKEKNQPLNLIDNYNWMIMMTRKNRKISRKQLADAIGESENAIRLIEERFLPDDALRVINKIEQYLNVRLKTSLIPMPVYKPIARAIKIDKDFAKNVTIDDLKKLKQAKENMDNNFSDLKKEMNVSEFVWKAKKEDKIIEAEPEEKKLIGENIELSE